MKTQKHKGVFFFFFKWQDATLVEEKTKKNKPKKKRKKWHCQNGRTGRRSEATNRLIWSVTLHAEVHEEKGAPSKMPPLSIWMNAGKTEEARSSRCLSRQNKRSLWKRYHPVWGTALVERVTFASAWISWVVHFIFFPHMHTFTVQRCPVCILKVRGHQRQKTPRPQARDPPQVTPREKRSCSHWCQTEGVSRLPVTGKSHLKVKNKNKSPRR